MKPGDTPKFWQYPILIVVGLAKLLKDFITGKKWNSD